MTLIYWILFGLVIGWLASMITGRTERMGCLTNIVVGIAGSFVGGVLGWLIFGGASSRHFILALVGAILLLIITGWFSEPATDS